MKSSLLLNSVENSQSLEFAEIVTHDGALLRVRRVGAQAPVSARLAAGALLQPAVGDAVVMIGSGDQYWILQVIERCAPDQPAELRVPCATDVVLSAPKLAVRTQTLELQAHRTRAQLGMVTLSAKVVKAVARRISLWANVIHSQAEALVVRAEQRVTQIDGHDLLKAGQILIEAEQLVRLEGDQVQLQAHQNVLIDGKRVVVG